MTDLSGVDGTSGLYVGGGPGGVGATGGSAVSYRTGRVPIAKSFIASAGPSRLEGMATMTATCAGWEYRVVCERFDLLERLDVDAIDLADSWG